MIASVDQIVAQAEQLPAAERLIIIRRLAASLLDSTRPETSSMLPYGAFSGGRQSTEEDFKLAEWHVETKWDGR